MMISVPQRTWDVVIIGAGPAGALAARELARLGVAVLLIDKSPFPRAKVCGACLNGAALATLERIGLGGLPAELGAVPLRCFQLSVGGGQARLALPRGAGLSRAVFDLGLVRAACAAGAVFLDRTTAEVGSLTPTSRRVVLSREGEPREVSARLVLAADGLGGRCLRKEPGFHAPAEDHSWVGASAVLPGPGALFQAGTIFMACGAGGYVGAVRQEDGRLNVAAALDPRCVRGAGGPGGAAARIAEGAGWPALPGLVGAAWRGTPGLTRRPLRRAGSRVLLLGDAAGYVEPFTGEGIAWALASAAAVAPLAAHALRHPSFDLAAAWEHCHRELVGRRQATCRHVTRLLRYPRLVRAALPMLRLLPGLAAPLVDRLNREAFVS